ncbi:MAG: type I restriction enzyme HsdR N-terminal domain-containing protein [Candidatus Azobacteroides sp.]|nr:type I restriction enzyme HsdR N-terminal domain-containing protein [Candidatus Azobacteroides sp.]
MNKKAYTTPLNLPDFSPVIKNEKGKYFIFDPLRKKYIALTPEEWVRQSFIHYLLKYKNYPAGRIGNEIRLIYNGLKKRCDSVVYNHFGQPIIIIEYKAPSVPITQHVFNQICVYNLTMQVPYLIVSNGLKHYCCQMDYKNKSYCFLEDIPDYNEEFEKSL